RLSANPPALISMTLRGGGNVKHKLATLLMLFTILATGAAQAGSAGEVEDVYLTVYNGNLSLIREMRSFDLTQGSQDLVLADVSGQLNPATVHLSFPGDVEF